MRLFLAAVLLALAALATAWWLGPRREGVPPASSPSAPARDAPHAFTPGEPPRLLPARAGEAAPATAPLAWERLLAADGSAREDLDALLDLVSGYLQAGPRDARGGIGFNEDLVSALSDARLLGETALPRDHPAIRDGRLVDRWGTPWQVHPLAADLIQVRSAGPDRRLYTADDLVAPPDSP